LSATLWPALPAVSDPIRLAEVESVTGLLNGAGSMQEALDRLTCLAAELLDAPVSILTLVSSDRQVFAGAHGLPEPLRSVRGTPLEYSLCQYIVETGAPLIVSDAARDQRVSSSRAVVELGVAAYAGMPVLSPTGHTLGALAVVDYVPRDWTDDRLALLAELAQVASDELCGVALP
jgi:GAF domain-containing protein